jgi:hypothetical protein
MESAWFAPLLTALNYGRIGSLVIDACNGRRIHATRRQQRALWKRARRFETRLTA